MTYRNKIITLSGVITALAIVYILTIIFDPQRRGSRSDMYSWLEPGQNNRISGITISRQGETVNITHNGGKWFITRNGKNYPARKTRVEDFLTALSKKAPYPVRSSNASSHERLSLTPENAVQVTVSAGAGPPLLALLIGQKDIMGQNVYLRKQGQDEVRSGEDKFSVYTNSSLISWFNLRLFPEYDDGRLSAKDIQRLIVSPPKNAPSQTFTRSGKEWKFSFNIANPDYAKVDDYLRTILDVSGIDFADDVSPSDDVFNDSKIVMELGNGTAKTVRLSQVNDDGERYASVSGSDLVYSIPGWELNRLFQEPDSFTAP